MNVFLDTMIYLHFSSIEAIDFCEVLGASAVTILVPRVTLRELEKHKSTHTTSRTRHRAAQVLSFLESAIESKAPIRSGVTLRFMPAMPQLDLANHDLNPAWNDDLLIASVLECRDAVPDVETVLITDDTGARLTCRYLQISTRSLP